MSEQYRLIFSGEVLDGQHAAVVKKRLQGVLKLDDARMEVLFSGKAVVVKKATDEHNAARYQEVFKKAGARLRVLPVEEGVAAPTDSSASASAPKPEPTENDQAAPADSATPAPSPGALGILPVGADILTDAERPPEQVVEVETSHLSVQGATFAIDDGPVVGPIAPNVDHISIAELGAQIGTSSDDVVVAEIEVDFDLADVGVTMGDPSASDPAPVIDMDQVDFDVADVGADMDTTDKPAPPPAPDTSHLQIADDDKA